jgi:uncharacterized protein (TIGR02391 family)
MLLVGIGLPERPQATPILSDLSMFDQQKRLNIARTVCSQFVREAATTKEHALLVEFKDPQLLSDMQTRNQLKLNPTSNEFQPAVGAFALLPDDDGLNQLARDGFLRTVPLLLKLFCDKGEGGEYSLDQFLKFGKEAGKATEEDAAIFRMGLYVCSEFGLLSPMAWSANGHDVKTFGVAKYVVTMEDPLPWWEQRVKHARAEPAAPEVGFPSLFGLDGDEFDETFDEWFPTGGFWTLIHPSIREEVSRRFAIHEYADAVMAALQVVAHTVREKTGIREDGARLMANAFGGDHPYLVFDDPMPQTQQAMQSGYQQLFSGAMTGVRNPKAHSLVTIDRTRCIHFLFLASLLAYKLDDASVVRKEP